MFFYTTSPNRSTSCDTVVVLINFGKIDTPTLTITVTIIQQQNKHTKKNRWPERFSASHFHSLCCWLGNVLRSASGCSVMDDTTKHSPTSGGWWIVRSHWRNLVSSSTPRSTGFSTVARAPCFVRRCERCLVYWTRRTYLLSNQINFVIRLRRGSILIHCHPLMAANHLVVFLGGQRMSRIR